jgi:hypothetical protein
MHLSPARWALPVVLALLGGLLGAVPASAASRVTPGSFTGFAFDTCTTPTSKEMDAWRWESPYWGVGVYLGGVSSRCDTSALTADWVTRQSRRGWRILPIWVGPQAACSETGYIHDISTAPVRGYVQAARQGRRNANQAVRTARALGIARGSTLWYDIEDYDLSGKHCRRSVLTFLSAWSHRLNRLGYTSGVYSNVAAAIHSLDYADQVSPGSYVMPGQVWYAHEDKKANVRIDEKWVRRGSWMPGGRMHQYDLDVTDVEHGGVTMKIDRNYLDVGRGSVAPRPRKNCGVRVDFADYRTLHRGHRGAQVRAAQCLLRQKRAYAGPVHGRYDVRTTRAVRAFQRNRDLRAPGRMTPQTWMALFAEGGAPIAKHGSAGHAVRRLQRALTAALDRRVRITGVFGYDTTRAVRQYQRARSMEATGVATRPLWRDLRRGLR